jgi:hypothetical protein
MLQRSRQVSTGIQALGGQKSFTGFGMQELKGWMNVQAIAMFDLTELKPLSVAMDQAGLRSAQQVYHVHRQNTVVMEHGAKRQLSEMVNVVDE